MKYLLLPCACLALQAAAQGPAVSARVRAAMDRVDSNSIRGHVAYLADDRLRGRLPGTEGYQLAVDYVTEQFKKMGVKPGGDAGAYTQKLLIRKSLVTNASAYAVLKDAAGNSDSLTLQRDFLPVPHPMRTQTSASGGLVFVGYGLDVPGEYSDYNNVDVKGKIVVLLTGAPDGFPSTITAHLSNMGSKFNAAAARGAAGVIVINPALRPGNPTNPPVLQSNAALNPDRSAVYSRHFTGNTGIALNAGRVLLHRLLMNSGKNIEQVLAGLKSRKPASFELPYTLSAGYSTTHTDIESYNVVGLIPGDDRRLRSEYVVHSAHLDHLGVGKPVNGDSIYNGAHDNASGVASLLEIARIYRSSGVRPKRSILMVLVTGEEMGLIGSSYFAANPTVPKGSIVADVNTDMPTVIAPLLSVVPLGAEHSTMMQHVQFAAKQLGLDVEKDPEPTENRFVRSDQYSFVLSGVPALHIKYGNKSDVPGFDLVSFVKQWRAKYYHQTADNLETGIFNFGAARKYVHLNFLVSYSIAQTATRPAWNKGDLFAPSEQQP
ncbi:M20/M25/M40 family metallo-hydrolase [Flaviaesturariibacter amylovorans]|uniref:M20/M25/M40 family metallo-hydrolase n=2 Tax=Flaviaesturariibacter amylovorans TaxID=1084520 RepID=A0ABP8H7R3_9BACT